MFPIFEDQCSLPKRKRKEKGKEKKKQKEKEKEKKKKKNKSRETLPLKPDALSLNWLGVIDLVFVTRVNG